MATWQSVIQSALSELGVFSPGDPVDTAQLGLAFDSLKGMLSVWANDGLISQNEFLRRVDFTAEGLALQRTYYLTDIGLPDASAPSVTVSAIPDNVAAAAVTLTASVTGGVWDSLDYLWSVQDSDAMDVAGALDDATAAMPVFTFPATGVTGDAYTISLTITARGTGVIARAGTSATVTGSATATVADAAEENSAPADVAEPSPVTDDRVFLTRDSYPSFISEILYYPKNHSQGWELKRETYARVTLMPSYAPGNIHYYYYSALYPYSELRFDEKPIAGDVIVIKGESPLIQETAALTDGLDEAAPEILLEAIKLNLAIRLSASYRVTPMRATTRGARQALQAVRQRHRKVHKSDLDPALRGEVQRHGAYQSYGRR